MSVLLPQISRFHERDQFLIGLISEIRCDKLVTKQHPVLTENIRIAGKIKRRDICLR